MAREEYDQATRRTYRNVHRFKPDFPLLYTLFDNQAGSMTNLAEEAVLVLMRHVHHGHDHTQEIQATAIASALALGNLESQRALPPRDDRGLRLGAGLAEGGETGIAYTVFLLVPGLLPVTTWLWVGVLATTVVARTLLARRLLAPQEAGSSAGGHEGLAAQDVGNPIHDRNESPEV